MRSLENFEEAKLAKKLKDIAISHISLVKAGANGKEIIYKSSDVAPSYAKEIKIAKNDEEKGVVYGIVYSPDQEDSQGDFADAEQIEKAAYAFMKNRNTLNVDQNHDFVNKSAYVAESWLLRKGDAIFPDESEGSWAVAIKLDSEELKEAVKKGQIAGLSMAGVALREEVEKATKAETKGAIEALLDVFKNLSVSINGYIEKSEQKEDKLKKEDIEQIGKSAEAITKAVDSIAKQNEELKKQNEELAKRVEAVEETLKKSRQDHTPKQQENKTYEEFL